MIEWEATDNFGNLMVARSSAVSLANLKEDLLSLMEEALHRTPEGARFAVDAVYGEVSAPTGSAVTHVLQIPWLSARVQEGESKEAVQLEIIGELASLLASNGFCSALAQGPWED